MGIIGTGGVTIINNGSANTNPDGDNTPVYFANCATPSALPTCTYNNGTSGVGATLTANSNGALTTTYTDGVALSVGLIVLVWKQTSALQNGLYEITQIGTAGTPWILTRLAIYDTTAEVYPSQVNILGGTTYANLYFLQQTASPTIGTSSIVYQTATAPTGTTINQNLRLVDTYTASALPTCTYTPNASAVNPALNAYLNASANGVFPTLNGVVPYQYMKVLVYGQADQTQNGDYILQNVGSASSTWRLSRISYTASALYPAWWGIYQGTGRGLIFEQTTSTLTTATIGVSGNIVFVQVSSAGLTYFTEAQNSSAPNATVKVDSLTAVASTTDADFSIVPKGVGAFQLAIPDNTSTGGNKRGANAVDLQTLRGAGSQVASGVGSSLIGGINNAISGTYAIGLGGYGNQSTNSYSISGGYSNISSGAGAIALGMRCTASGEGAVSLGGSSVSGSIASADFAIAIGYGNTASAQGSVAIGIGATANALRAVALGASNTASGQYSFVGGGTSNTASGDYSISMSQSCTASGIGAIAIGYLCTATSTNSISIGRVNTSSGAVSVALGYGVTSNGRGSLATGIDSSTFSIEGRHAHGNNLIATLGDGQKSTLVLKKRTTDATLSVLTTDASASIGATNIFTLQNNNAIRFKGSVIGKQTGSTNVSVWDIDGVIVRGANAGTTTIAIGNVTLVVNSILSGTPTLTADTTNGALRVNVIGLIATNIQWTALLETTEVIYA